MPMEEAAPPTPAVPPGKEVPGAKPPTAEEAAPPELGAPSPTGLARGGVMGGVPNMIGDFFFGNGFITVGDSNSEATTVPIGGSAGLFKVADDNNPIPTDRIICNYNLFNNALLAADGRPRNFNRIELGLEKTFFDGQSSVEFRIPFGNGLNATQSLSPDASLMATEFGNVPIVFKTLLWRCEHQAFAVGAATILPTARDGRMTDPNGDPFLVIQNDAWHIQPFFGWLWAPQDRRLFLQLFGEVDFADRGNDVLVPGIRTGELVSLGRYNDQTLGLLDLKIGYWLYNNPDARWVTGLVPTCELHYTTTLQNADTVGPVTNPFNRVDALDLTGGVHIMLGTQSVLTIAGALPMKTQDNRMFDAEAMVQFNRRF